MKKIFKAIVAALTIIVLAGCSNVSANYAEKINIAVAKEEPFTYGEVLETLGQPHVDVTVTAFGSTNGWALWYKGYKSSEEAEAALEAGKTVASITVTVVNNKVTKAQYSEDKKTEDK